MFLDVDCIPSPDLLERYAGSPSTMRSVRHRRLSATRPPGGYAGAACAPADPHPARPVPPEDERDPGGDHTLFWSLSFAITRDAWRRVGGFCEGYIGYGGEDTDFGQRARAAGLGPALGRRSGRVPPAPSRSDPPVEHLDDILRNGALFAERWGWWPMEGWLRAFAERGLIRPDGDGWARIELGSAGA